MNNDCKGRQLQFLWLLANLNEGNRLETATAMLGIEPGETKAIVDSLSESGLIHLAGGDCVASASGRAMLHSIAGPREKGNETAALMGAFENGDMPLACEHCLKLLYESHGHARGVAAAGWLDLLLSSIMAWPTGLVDETHNLARFVMDATGAAIYYLRCTERVNIALARVSSMARLAGNSHLLCQLTFGRGAVAFFMHSANLGEAHTICSEAQALLNRLDDAELHALCRPFILLRHFLAGEYQQVMEVFEAIRRSGARKTPWPLLDAQTIILASSAAAYSGNFADAAAMLNSAADTAEIEQAGADALLYRQHLGILQAYMCKHGAAMKTLQKVLAAPLIQGLPKVLFRAWMGVAFCHARAGRIKKSHSLLAQTFASSRHDLGERLTWNYPWLLELAVLYEGAGLPALPELDFQKHLNLLMRSKNPFAHGCALRFLAERQLQMGRSHKAILKLAQKAVVRLNEAGAILDEGLAWRFKSMILERCADYTAAEHAAMQARVKLGFLGLSRLVNAAGSLGDESSHGGGNENDACLFRRICAELGSFEDWESLEEYCNGAAAILRKHFRAGRVIIFMQTGGQPASLGLCNITRLELEHRNFAGMLALVAAHIKKKSAAIRLYANSVIVLVPFALSTTDLWLIYLEGGADCAHVYHEDGLASLAVFCAAQLRLAARVEKAGRRHELPPSTPAPDNLIRGRSRAFSLCLKRAELVAGTEAAVLLLGETGVGKEVLARYIHEQSGRSGPLVCVHPAAMTESLFENEFFGHEKGAFTGASGRKVGFCELAHNGTLFIDEAGEIPLAMQGKLLRVLQERRFTRVGGTREINSSFRLLAATNRKLEEAVRAGLFREDLYYRIAVFPIHIPPLRERLEDIETLYLAYAAHFASRYDKKMPSLDTAALERLKSHPWPGNIRELKNAVERAVILSTDIDKSIAAGVPDQHKTKAPDIDPLGMFADMPDMASLERRYLAYVMEKTAGRIDGPRGAAALLGMSRSTLYARLKEWGIPTAGRKSGRNTTALSDSSSFG